MTTKSRRQIRLSPVSDGLTVPGRRNTLDNLGLLTEIGAPRKAHESSGGDLLVHGIEKLFIALRAVQFIEQEFHRLDDAQLRENLAQNPDATEVLFGDQ